MNPVAHTLLEIAGRTAERVLRAPVSGELYTRASIGDRVTAGQPVGSVDGHEIRAGIDGVVRGLLHSGLEVAAGWGYLVQGDFSRDEIVRVADELHRQYLIGISPGQLDGKLHKLELRVKQPGMTARARKSYMATKEAPAPDPR